MIETDVFLVLLCEGSCCLGRSGHVWRSDAAHWLVIDTTHISHPWPRKRDSLSTILRAVQRDSLGREPFTAVLAAIAIISLRGIAETAFLFILRLTGFAYRRIHPVQCSRRHIRGTSASLSPTPAGPSPDVNTITVKHRD